MSLHHTLLYLLSLSSMSFAGDQDVLMHPVSLHRTVALVTNTISYNGHTPSQIADPSLSRVPHDKDSSSDNESTPSCSSDEKWCPDTDSCIPLTHDCCSASKHCFPGDYCFHHDAEVRCCPQGLECFQISSIVCIEQPVFWYEEVYIVEEDSDEVTTSWDLLETMLETRTPITVTASYPGEGRASFSSLSSSIIQSAVETPLELDLLPTRTTTVVRTPTVKLLPFGGLPGFEGQVVLG
ncbi:hypothetical protein BDW59DRAFT_96532 [Aspergillus cavernicola]|uniref:Granulins domain-containing protein n=1 Tax=Aspergillus cavernicola TaxID=176166 RepID=A0ABR4I731_9EURO